MKTLLIALLLNLFGLNLSAQENLSGIWKTDKDNTHVKIERQNDVFIGKVISSDDKNIMPGTLMIKKLKLKKEKLEGEIYVPSREQWFDGTFQVSGSNLTITVTLLFISKSVVWTKQSK